LEDKPVGNFEADAAVMKWEAALDDLRKGQAALAAAMKAYGAGEAEYPCDLVANVLRLRGVHEKRYDAAQMALHLSSIAEAAPPARLVQYVQPPAAPATAGGKWRPHLASAQAGANVAARAQ
jgi:hypothetical protein